MSIHALVATAYLEELDPAVKLVLMALADSSDERTRHTAPGMPKLRAWSGRSKSQVSRVLRDLEEGGYLARVSPGRIGQRAVWQVFPNGLPTIPHPDEVAARFAPPTTSPPPVDNSRNEGRTDATLETQEGRISGQEGRIAVRPLPVSSSVYNAPRKSTPRPRPVDRRTGFPGAVVPARASGPVPTTCHLHPGKVLPCPRCEADRLDATDAQRIAAESAAQLRLMMQRNRDTRPD
jgi:hypothetical protein